MHTVNQHGKCYKGYIGNIIQLHAGATWRKLQILHCRYYTWITLHGLHWKWSKYHEGIQGYNNMDYIGINIQKVMKEYRCG